MALEAKNIYSFKDMQNFVEGCINDLDFGISDSKETIKHLKDYTFRLIELCAGMKVKSENGALPVFDVSYLMPDLELHEAKELAMETDYAVFAVEDENNEINTVDAAAFFLEGYNHAKGICG